MKTQVDSKVLSIRLLAKLIKETEEVLYTYPGGSIAPLLHECRQSDVELFSSKTEQGAGYMAIAHASLTGRPAFVAVTSGPGATNLITCLADAYYDSIPIIAITGQIGTAELGRSPSLRQRGFQETPVVTMVRPVTKAVFQPLQSYELPGILINAYNIAQSARRGPVLIDLPMDVQLEKIDIDLLSQIEFRGVLSSQTRKTTVPNHIVEQITATLSTAQRPLILTGGGAQNDWERIRSVATQYMIPVVSSLRGLGIMSYKDPFFSGWIGHTGLSWANWTLAKSDWVLVLGSRLDVRQTGTEVEQLENKTIVHIDIDQNELSYGRFNRTFQVCGSINSFLEHFIHQMRKQPLPDWSRWRNEIRTQKEKMRLNDHGQDKGICPDQLLSYIDELTRETKTAVVTGVGSHQQWAARYFSFEKPNKLFFTSAGHGTMGYCLPVAIGIKRIETDRLVIAIDGDGSFQMNIQELALLGPHDINLKIIIMDNNRLGLVSQFQQITFGDDPTTGTTTNPNFVDIAKAYCLESFKLDKFDSDKIREWLFCSSPSLLHVNIQHDAPVSPMLLAGNELDDMWYWHR